VALDPAEIATLSRRAETGALNLSVDLQQCVVTTEDGFKATFQVEPFGRMCLLEGLDEIGMTLKHGAEIVDYEKSRPRNLPALAKDQSA